MQNVAYTALLVEKLNFYIHIYMIHRKQSILLITVTVIEYYPCISGNRQNTLDYFVRGKYYECISFIGETEIYRS